jgi:alcohol dehydrogenase, propanol-preferring
VKAWQLGGVGEPLRLIDHDVPVPGHGQVLIKVRAAGMCHTDIGILDGHVQIPRFPLVLGHEVAGVVEAVGPGVDDIGVGDRIAVTGDLSDPSAAFPGVLTDGGYAEYTLGEARLAVQLPDGVLFEQAAAAADAGSTSYGAVMTAGKLKPGQRIGIIGIGGLGSTGAKIAALKGGEVYVAEPKEELWDAARAHGAVEVVTDAREWAGRGFDVVVDFAGFDTTTHAIRAVRRRGLVVQIGAGQPAASISVLDLIESQVTLRGFMGGALADVRAVIDLMHDEGLEITLDPVAFEEIPETLERLRRGKVTGRAVALL